MSGTGEGNKATRQQDTEARETEAGLRGRAMCAASNWLDLSCHERTDGDALILARYARLAIDKIVPLEKLLKEDGDGAAGVLRAAVGELLEAERRAHAAVEELVVAIKYLNFAATNVSGLSAAMVGTARPTEN